MRHGQVWPLGNLPSRPFWTLCHIRWLEDGSLGDNPFATFTGRSRQRVPSDSDDQTRLILRHLGGIFVRSLVSVYSDCPIARGWWRRKMAVEASKAAPENLDVDAAHRALHRSRPVWEEFVSLCRRRLTVVNQPRGRAAIIAYMVSHQRSSRDDVADVARNLARYGLEHSLDHVPWPSLTSALQPN